MSNQTAEEFLKERINIPESDSPTFIPFEECVEDLENYAEQRLTTLKEKIKNIDGFKEGECVELLAKDHVLTLINEELQ